MKRSSRGPSQVRGETRKAADSVTTMQPTNTSEGKAKRPPRKGQAARSDAYETWLDHRLKSLYQPMLEAPLPDDMVKLLRGRKPS
jgi:hypothetical protein